MQSQRQFSREMGPAGQCPEMGREGSCAFYSCPTGFEDLFHPPWWCWLLKVSSASQHDEHGKTGNGRLEFTISGAKRLSTSPEWSVGSRFVMKGCTLEPERHLPSPCHLVTEGELVSQCASYAGVPTCTQLLPCALLGGLFGCGRQPDICSTAPKVATPRLNPI